jgi:hypothetical protein
LLVSGDGKDDVVDLRAIGSSFDREDERFHDQGTTALFTQPRLDFSWAV